MRTKLIIILLIAGALRLWNLGGNPPHLTPDEAALGYNAYSILRTARDEHGSFLPLVFKSFGDYKPGLYVYAAIPFVGVVGLNEVAVRIPSAISGIVGVWLLYLIIGKLFPKEENLALIGSFVLAVSPWHIQFSRGAWEVNLSLTLTLAGIYFFILSFKKYKYLVYSAVFFGLTLLAYQGAKLATSIVLLSLILAFWREFRALFKNHYSTVVKSAVLGLIISLPILLSLVQGRAGRLKVFSVFSYTRPSEVVETFLSQSGVKHNGLVYKLFYSQDLAHLRGVAGRWFNHFSTRFLFFQGDWKNPKFSPPNHGMMLLGDLIFMIVGLVGLMRFKGGKKFIWLWLFLAPLPAALSRDQIHAVRAFNMVIPLSIIVSLGVYLVLKKPLMRVVVVLVYLVGITYYLDSYFVHQPIHNAKYWHYGNKQVVEELVRVQGDYKTIRWQQSYDQPYIYYLFYTEYSPRRYQSQNSFVDGGLDVGLVEKIDNIEFSRDIPGITPALVIADSVKISPETIENQRHLKLISKIDYPDGVNAFNLIEVE